MAREISSTSELFRLQVLVLVSSRKQIRSVSKGRNSSVSLEDSPMVDGSELGRMNGVSSCSRSLIISSGDEKGAALYREDTLTGELHSDALG